MKKYHWLEEDLSCTALSKLIGTKVLSITRGHVTVGYEDQQNENGEKIKMPVLKRGMIVETERELDDQQLGHLDYLNAPLVRAEVDVEDESFMVRDKQENVFVRIWRAIRGSNDKRI
jgi:hypothetical protein